jgi:uncharacterized lipoprotein NlpE involved in copper resistance
MKYINKILLLLFTIVLIGCNQPASTQNEPEGLSDQEFEQTENFVDIHKATSIASIIQYPLTSSPNDLKLKEKGATSKFKKVEETLAIPDDVGNPAYYILNYKEDGFIMISADNRVNPVRAYSLTNKFPINTDSLPSGLLSWMMESSEMISQIRALNEEQSIDIKNLWDDCEIQRFLGISRLGLDLDIPCEGDGDCENQHTQVGPLLSTTWGQWTGYNNFVPLTGCNSSNGRAPAGCVATAMAQIMKYYEHPNDYDWSNMPNNYGTNETSQLMVDIGDAVDMDYDCNGSGAYMNDVPSAFTEFGYSNANYSEFRHLTVKDQLNWEKPVILGGFSEEDCFLWWCSYEDGHAWVTDGYKQSTYCETGTSYLYLHMNWGWSGNEDGWYAYNNWNPGDNSYNYEKEMIYNINP